MSGSHRGYVLRGRRVERASLDRLLAEARASQGQVLVLLGEAGVGKTALLDYLQEQASGFRVARVAGVESEMELAFAGLHQFCAPMLSSLASLPEPQRSALHTVFGLSTGEVPDRLLVGLAVLGLLSEVAEEQPLLCLVDDAQWLDQASAQALAFVARRLLAEPVALVFAVRDPAEEQQWRGLPRLKVEGLRDADARGLLDAVALGRLDERVRDRIVAESRGNPLALLELPKGMSAAELAGGFGLPDALPVAGRIERSFLRRLGSLPVKTQRLLLVAAAEPIGDVALLWRAAGRLGVGADAAAPAEAAGLIELGVRVRFRHPLLRGAVYRAAALPDRREVHRALAEATDPGADPDRRAWHRARAAAGPDEAVAGELERSADRAQGRGGVAAAAAFLQRSAGLTADPARRGARALAAAAAAVQAGAFDTALGMLGMAEAGPLGDAQRAQADMIRAQLAFVSNRGRDAPPLLLAAARRLEGTDVGLARATYLDTINAALFAGHLASPGVDALAVSCAARMAPPAPGPARAPDLLLEGLAANFSEGYQAGLPVLQQALAAFGQQMSAAEELRWLWLACIAALHMWDDEQWDALSRRHVELAREVGALGELPLALSSRVFTLLFTGELTAAASLASQARAVTETTGSNLAPYGAMGLAALHGREAEAAALIRDTGQEVAQRGEGVGVTLTNWANAVLYNSLGRYNQALAAAEQGSEHLYELGLAPWSLIELIEAATRAGQPGRAADALRVLSETTSAAGTDWALGIQARSRALLADGGPAEPLYLEAIERLGRTRVRMELARAHLVYGEWLRRENRRADARRQLRAAHDMFGRFGAGAFAERARRELQATGETVRKRTMDLREALTAQEAQVARLAAEGHTNPEIGAQLYISHRTAEYHLHKVFSKLGISSRRQLRHYLAQPEPHTT
jgi:DNA-binding CsgD family transcriptional regulator